jgi:antitoxin PrlF
MTVTVTSKGQVTVPKQVRGRLGIKPGSKVDFEVAKTVEPFCARWVNALSNRAALSESEARPPAG